MTCLFHKIKVLPGFFVMFIISNGFIYPENDLTHIKYPNQIGNRKGYLFCFVGSSTQYKRNTGER